MKNYITKVLLLSIIIVVGFQYCHAKKSQKQEVIIAKDTTRSEKAKLITENMVKERLAKLESTVHLPYHKNVKGFVDYYVNRNTKYTATMLTRAKVYYPLFEKHLKKHGLPLELKHLAVVESGLNPIAVSRVGATGLWQFMPSTGRLYGLKRDNYFDDRMDPEKSTIAACRHLKDLYREHKSWPLVLAAYNSGSGNVRKAIRRSGHKRKFWEMYRRLPRETRAYVPQFMAVMYAMEYAEQHEIYEIDSVINTIIPLDTVSINGYFNINALAKAIDLDIEEISLYNPALLRSSIPGDIKNYPLKLPYYNAKIVKDRKDYFIKIAEEKEEKDIIFKNKHRMGTYGRKIVYYRVKSGDVLGTIATRFKVKVSNIKTWNRIRGTTIYVGQRLKLYVRGNIRNKYLKDLKNKKPIKPSKSIKQKNIPVKNNTNTYTVRSGDTLWDISRGFEISIKKLKELNNLKSNRIKPNMVLIIK